MTTATATITIKSVHVIGDMKMVLATVDFDTYATNGLAVPISTFGLVEFIYAFMAWKPGEAFYHYDGTTIVAYVDADSEDQDGVTPAAFDMVILGK